MKIEDKVIEVMKEANKPLSAGEIATLGNFDRKEVDKAMKNLKKEELIVSPIRCKWEPTIK